MNDLVGDPTALGWGTTLAYLFTFALLQANALRARRTNDGFVFWVLAGLVILALGLNKQLDLQTWLGEGAKTWVVELGLYEQRRVLQLAFVLSLAAGGATVIWILRRWSAKAGGRYRLVLAGLYVSVTFVVVRAATFHGLERFVGAGGIIWVIGVALELSAIALVVAGALRWRRE